MTKFRLPLSGNVTQTFPWTWAPQFNGVQFGGINIELGTSASPEIEGDVLDEVGSYGRQLGRLTDALLAVLRHIEKKDGWSKDERAAVEIFRKQAETVEGIKDRHQVRLGQGA